MLESASEVVTVRSEPWISDASYWMPRHVVQSAWLEHAPFAFWLVDATRPNSIVELGTHNGFSYFVFCEAVRRLGLPTKTFALDSWEGDDQAGFYGTEVYDGVVALNSEYSDFSTLLRGYFDDSLDAIPDASVDLLHIDGRHGYDDVRHDFEAWLPKLTDRGVVVFHDVAEHQEGFGVWQFWEEVSEQHPSFAFDHEHGLGVLAVGREVPPKLRDFIAAAPDHSSEIKDFYATRGADVSRQYSLLLQSSEVEHLRTEAERLGAETERLRTEAERMRGELEAARQDLGAKARAIAARDEELGGLREQLAEFGHSTSWKVTRPLRAASDLIHRRKA
jgi:hypothetical protein